MTKVSREQVIKAIKGSAGVKKTIALRLSVSRPSVDAYLRRWKSASDAYMEEKSGVDDIALSVVINDIVNNKDVGTAKWWLTKKLPEFSDKITVNWRKKVDPGNASTADDFFRQTAEALAAQMKDEPTAKG